MDGLIPAVGTDDIPSYHGYNGSVSKIDYVLVHKDSCLTHGIKTEDVKIVKQICKEDDPSIISTHDAFYFEVKYEPILADKNEIHVCKSVDIVQKRK